MKKEPKRIPIEAKDDDDNVVKGYIRKPGSSVLARAQRVHAKVWTDCVRDKIMTKQELQNFMYENNVWNSEKDLKQLTLSNDIQKLEKSLYVGSKGQKTMKASEAKQIAIDMRIARAKLRDLIAERMSLEQNTAEALADNAKFDVLVASCTFDENDNRVYSSVDDYSDNSDTGFAFAAATAMAELLYSLDKDFEKTLPENKFLSDQGYVNDELSLVNKDGETVDTEGRRINEFGYYVNDSGKRTDIEGNLLDENGNYIPSMQYVEDEEVPKKKVAKKKATAKKKAATSFDS